MDGFFDMRTAGDLREKLRRDFAKFSAEPLDVDAFFNFLLTAEHMADWVLPGKANKKARQAIWGSSIYLQVCSHLANGAKHHRVEAKHHRSVSSTEEVGFDPPGYNPPGYNPPGYDPIALVVILKEDAASVLGERLLASDLVEQIMAFWNARPLDEADS